MPGRHPFQRSDYPNVDRYPEPDSDTDGDDHSVDRQFAQIGHQLPELSLSNDSSDVEHPRLHPDSQLGRSYDSAIYGHHDSYDEEGYSLSTAAHHTSALTLSAGLAVGQRNGTDGGFDHQRHISQLDWRDMRKDMSMFSHSSKPSLSATLHDRKSPKRTPKARTRTVDKENRPIAGRSTVHHTPQHRLHSSDVVETGARSDVRLPDITGITAAASSPPRVNTPTHVEPPSHHHQTIVNSLQDQLETVTREAATAKAEVKVLERELQRKRQAEQELSLRLQEDGTRVSREQFEQVVQEKNALQSLVESLVGHQRRLEASLRESQDELRDLKANIVDQEKKITSLASKLSKAERELRGQDLIHHQRSLEIQRLRDDIARLERECIFLRGCVEKGLRSIQPERTNTHDQVRPQSTVPATRPPISGLTRDPKPQKDQTQTRRATSPIPSNPAREPRRPFDAITTATAGDGSTRNTRFIDENELSRLADEISGRRTDRSRSSQDPSVEEPRSTHIPRVESSRVHVTANTVVDPDVKETERTARRRDNEELVDPPRTPPFPRIRGKHMERLFFSAPPHNEKSCHVCKRKRQEEVPVSPTPNVRTPQWAREKRLKRGRHLEFDIATPPACPSSPVSTESAVTCVISELEDDFAHYKAIYADLAEQYRLIDAASNVPKRNILADHLREIINVLEKKGDQIAVLYRTLDTRRKRGTQSP